MTSGRNRQRHDRVSWSRERGVRHEVRAYSRYWPDISKIDPEQFLGEVHADLFYLVDVSAAGVDSLACPAFCVAIAEVGEDGFFDCGAGNVLASDKRDGSGKPFVVGL